MRSAVAALVPVALLVTPHPASSDPDPAPESPFASMLGLVPASSFQPGTDAMLTYIDMEMAWSELGVPADPADRIEHLVDVGIAFGSPQLFGPYAMDIEGAEAEVGFSTLDIVREVAVLLPPNSLVIDVTSVAPLDVVSALEANPTWSSELMQVDFEHGPYFSWGEGSTPDPGRRSPFRPLGQAGQFAVLGDETAATVRTLDPATMEAMLGTFVGETEAVVGGDLLGPVVELLGGSRVVQLMSVPRAPVLQPPPDATPELIEQLAGEAVQPYVGLTIAELLTDSGRTAQAFLLHTDDETAAANGETVERALADGIDVMTNQPLSELLPGASVSVVGSVVRVIVPGDESYRVLSQMLTAQALFPAAG